MSLHQTLKGGFGFLATEGLFRLASFSTDPPLGEREKIKSRLEPSSDPDYCPLCEEHSQRRGLLKSAMKGDREHHGFGTKQMQESSGRQAFRGGRDTGALGSLEGAHPWMLAGGLWEDQRYQKSIQAERSASRWRQKCYSNFSSLPPQGAFNYNLVITRLCIMCVFMHSHTRTLENSDFSHSSSGAISDFLVFHAAREQAPEKTEGPLTRRQKPGPEGSQGGVQERLALPLHSPWWWGARGEICPALSAQAGHGLKDGARGAAVNRGSGSSWHGHRLQTMRRNQGTPLSGRGSGHSPPRGALGREVYLGGGGDGWTKDHRSGAGPDSPSDKLLLFVLPQARPAPT